MEVPASVRPKKRSRKSPATGAGTTGAGRLGLGLVAADFDFLGFEFALAMLPSRAIN
jgi:hypothetical protein